MECGAKSITIINLQLLPSLDMNHVLKNREYADDNVPRGFTSQLKFSFESLAPSVPVLTPACYLARILTKLDRESPTITVQS